MAIDFIISGLNQIVFENEVWRYLAFILCLIVVYPVSKLTVYIINNFLLKFAEKTDFKFDDILIKSINPPINMFILAGMFYLGGSLVNWGVYNSVFIKIFNFLIIVPLVFFLIKFSTESIGYYLKGDKNQKRINEAAIDLLMQIVRIALFFVGILLILANLGYNVSALLAGLGVGGLAFALAAQDIIKNFFAGVTLVFDKTFNKGERIEFEGNSGIIEELKLRSTKLRAYDGSLLTIPNSKLSENIVSNVTKVPKVKVSQTFGVVYNTSSAKLKKAKEIIEKAILDEELTDKDSYSIWFDEFNASSLDIRVIYYGAFKMDKWEKRIRFKERVNFAIKEGFEKAGIEFAYPTQTIELKK